MEERSRELMVHLPYLRRYARALTGSVAQGDALVTRILERLLDADPVTAPVRRTLYGHLNALADQEGFLSNRTASHPVERALNSLDETDRRLYLLVNLEEVTLGEAAEALALPPGEAVERLSRSREAVRAHLTATARAPARKP